MASHKSPGFRRYASAIETHRPFGPKDSYWRGEALALVESRNDFLSHKRTRRDMMRPPQAIDISCQAFTPGSSDFVRSKIIEPAPRQNALLWEQRRPGISDLHHHLGRLAPSHPAASCSSELSPPPISSRTGPRFPGRRAACGDEDCCSFACIC